MLHMYLSVTGISKIILRDFFKGINAEILLNDRPYGSMDYPLPDLKRTIERLTFEIVGLKQNLCLSKITVVKNL